MLNTLLKKQMSEIFSSYFYDSKKNQKRSPAFTVLLFVLYAFLVVGVLGGMFTMLSVVLCGTFVSLKIGWMYFAVMGMLAVLFGTFGSVFNTFTGLYLSKDNDLMLSLPIPVRYIMTARLLSVYLMGLMYSGIVMIPACVVYLITAPLSIIKILSSVLIIIIVSAVVLVLSCVLGWAVAKISLKLKNKSFITVLSSVVFIAVYYFVYFKAQTVIKDLLLNAGVYGAKVKDNAYPLYLFGKAAEGDLPAVLIVTFTVAVIAALTYFVLSRSFLKIAISSGKIARIKGKPLSFKAKKTFNALFGKELCRFATNPNYMLNCGFGILFVPVFGIFLLFKGGTIYEILNEIFVLRPGCAEVVICTAVLLLASMNDMATPSVSLEGKSVWQLQALPVLPWKILLSKLCLQIVFTAIPVLFVFICIAVTIKTSLLTLVALFFALAAFVLLYAVFCLALGIKTANIAWTNEIVPIKQSMGVMISLLGAWAYSVLSAVGYFLIGYKIGPALYLVAFSAVSAILADVLFVWIKNKGTIIFAEL